MKLENKSSYNRILVNDITQLNPITVEKIINPKIVQEVSDEVKKHKGFISIGGGRYSMGGQIAMENSLHIDMRSLNNVIEFNPEQKYIHVQAGIRWRDIQELIDKHNLAIKIMQSYSNFTVGGTLNVNAHGRYIGLGPVILSVKYIKIVLANGEIIEASPKENSEMFYGAIGGYGGIGIIVEAKLDLVSNVKVERKQQKLKIEDYSKYFFDNIRSSNTAIFHNADLYPPHYTKARAISWLISDSEVTVQDRLIPKDRTYLLEKYFIWAVSATPFGKLRREYIIDPIILSKKKVVWRNYEASYDVAELEPFSRKKSTYVLLEYFVPTAKFEEFVPKMAEILQRFKVNVLNISVRHALKDPGSIMAWAREEVFAFVLYYKQGTDETSKHEVAIWTRELIDAAISCSGTYYLPYQPHATIKQFHNAYPRAKEFFLLKERLDPTNKFSNKLWDKYYLPYLTKKQDIKIIPNGYNDFQVIFSDPILRDKFYLFLQNVYNIYNEKEFHYLIFQACELYKTDEEIYKYIQQKLPTIKPILGGLRYALPALAKQKKEMTKQTLEILGKNKVINGYAEIGTTGRYISHLQNNIKVKGPIYLINDQESSNSLTDIVERGGLKKIGKFMNLDNYLPIKTEDIPDSSIDVVTCYIGLHHSPLDKLDGFIHSINRILRPDGKFIVRDHDVNNPEMNSFVALAHAVFNAGLGVSWEVNKKELRHFTSVDTLIKYLEERGLKFTGKKIFQKNDPSLNALMEFVKEGNK